MILQCVNGAGGAVRGTSGKGALGGDLDFGGH